MVKKLVAVGCSYTASDWPFPVWPQVLSEKLNLDCVNLGNCGSGNEYIFSQGLDALNRFSDIGIMVVMWSEFQRTDWYRDNGRWDCLHFKCGDVYRNIQDWRNELMDTLTLKGFDNKNYQIDRSLRFMYSLQTIARSLNIPFFHLVGCDPIHHDYRYKGGMRIINSPYFHKIEMLGWPILEEIGGWTIDTWLDKVDGSKKRGKSKLRISETDSHPNEEGHKRIANKLYKDIKNGGYKIN